MRVTLLALCVCFSFSLPTAASADAAAEARFHDELARRHYAAGRYEDAAREFMVEQRLAPNPNIVFNIALCFQQLRRHADAYMYFAEYLASDDEDPTRRQTSERALIQLRPRVALVDVRSTPPGLDVYVDRRELGQYGVTPRVLALSAGEHTIWIEGDGYRRAETTVDVELGGERQVTLSPEQILGRLVVNAAARADVRVFDAEGQLAHEGQTPLDEPMPPGTYRVVATAGEERWSEPVVVRADTTTEATATLSGPTGEVTVTANVTGALVTLDGRDSGFTPQVLASVPVGAHELRVTADGMNPYVGQVEIEQDDQLWVTLELEPASSFQIQPVTWIVGGISLAIFAAAGVTTGFAADAHGRFQSARMMGQPILGLADESNHLNLAADILWLSAGVAAIAAIVLALTTTESGSRPSRATFSRREVGQ